ncbi:MAG: hypothetical protein JSW71_06060 [Gemmatimonadota bacterium]|nr:MAG: hypothetical protein JSW71_06060 [Gemmatimonadota bacterium]
MAKAPARCEWVSLKQALRVFAATESSVQGQGHIRPLHWYIASRLVIEGGFLPDEITPRPPFRSTRTSRGFRLEHDPEAGRGGERTVLGGLKTKVVDVVVTKNGIGPVVAVSVKGTIGAFRNLTNRMEEAVGDCTNLHISYPALVYGFFQVMKANREGPRVKANDVAIRSDGRVSDQISRYHDALVRLAGRDDTRDDVTKYEAVCMILASPDRPTLGDVVETYPVAGSPLLSHSFFERIYAQYEQRFIFAAPSLETTTRRLEWSPDSPVIGDSRAAGYEPRVAAE